MKSLINSIRTLIILTIGFFLSTNLFATDLYWIGGSGNWDDANNWSATSGGSAGTVIPTSTDNVFFDALSFTAPSQQVNINTTASCNNMDWTGAVNNPVLTGSSDLDIYGSLTLISGMNCTFAGYLYFKSTIAGNTIASAGKSFLGIVLFDGVDGDWTLQDAFSTTGTIYLVNGTLTTNNKNLTGKTFYSNYTNTRGLFLGSSTVTMTGFEYFPGYSYGAWGLVGANYSLDAGTSTIRLSDVSYPNFYVGGLDSYYNVLFQDVNAGAGISGGIYFNSVIFNGQGTTTTTAATFATLTFSKNGTTNGNNNSYPAITIAETGIINGDNNTFSNINFTQTGTINGTNNSFSTVNFSQTGTINGANHSFSTVNFAIDGTINGTNHSFGSAHFLQNGTINGNNSFDSLFFTPAKIYTLESNKTQNINSFQIDGTCSQPVIIAASAGTQANVSSSTTNVTVNYVRITSINATGGAVFTANNSTDLGNNTGWVMNTPVSQNLFWVGGSGNWNDSTHWSTTSGGTSSGCIPTRYDSVFFDASSFTSIASKNVTINVTAYCKNMNWTGALFTPALTGSADLYIYGSLTLISGMTNTFTGQVIFNSTISGNTITSAGKSFSSPVNFNGVGGSWTLQDAFSTTGTIYLVNGTLNTNNKNLTGKTFWSNYTNTRGLFLGSSTVTMTGFEYFPGYSYGAWGLVGANYSLDAGTSTIRLSDVSYPNFYVGNLDSYNNVLFQDVNAGAGISGGIYFNSVIFNGQGTTTTTAATFATLTFSKNGTTNGNNNSYPTITIAETGIINGDNNTFSNINFTQTGTINGTNNSFSTVNFSQAGTINGANHSFSTVNFAIDGSINGTNHSFGSAHFLQNGTINGNNSFDSLFFTPAKTYTLESNKTQNINSYQIDGTCSQPVIIAASAGTQATISTSTANVTVNYIRMTSINATGGVVFTANNSTDLGNNSGWTINVPAAQNLYWIGGTGNWDNANHWSTSSGGTSSGCIPTRYDSVFFDVNSFTSVASKTVTINVPASCKNMNWTGALFTPALTGSADLYIYGSLTLISGMTNTFTGQVIFNSTNTGNTITSAGKSFSSIVNFYGVGGGWILQDAFTTTGTIYLVNGTLTTNNKNLTGKTFWSNYTNTRGLFLGSSTVTMTGFEYFPGYSYGAWGLVGANYSLDAGTSTIRLSDVSYPNFYVGGLDSYYNVLFQDVTASAGLGGGSVFHNVTFNGTGTLTATDGATFNKVTFLQNGTINSNNSFDTLMFTAGKTYTLYPTKTQTIENYFKADGTSGSPITIYSNSGTQANISKNTCIVCTNYLNLTGINAMGGADFYANNGTNSGNNSGWNFAACPASSMIFSTSQTNVSCNNGSNGKAKVYVSCGTGPFTYLWSTTAITDSIVNLSAGTYTVTITDNNGGTTDTAFVISEPTILSSTASSTASCSGQSTGSVTAVPGGGTTPYSYAWSTTPVKTTITVTGLSSGGYTVTVTDANGCTSISTANVGTVNAPTVTPSQTNVSCNAGSDGTATANAVGGSTPYSYSWSNGQNTATNIGLSAGTYSVTVTGANSCASTGSITVLESATPLTATATATAALCNNISNGTATANGVGGTSPYAYLWSNGQTTGTATGLAIGTYNATVTDSTGCEFVTASVTVSQPTALGLTIASVNAKCDLDNGSATATVTGGTTPYSYNWSNGDASVTADSLASGSYLLTVTDANGCIKTGSKNIFQLGNPAVSIPSPVNVNCFGNCDGSATAIVSGGTAPYIYLWDDAAATTTTTASGLCAGTYSFSVTDNNGCVNTVSATITEPTALVISVSAVSSACNDHTGAATASASGGLSPYNYAWSSGHTNSSADSLTAGIYTVTVTETNGCSQFSSFTISDVGGPNVTTVSVTHVSCFGGSNGVINNTISGTAPPYTHLWSNGATTEDIAGLSAGPYQDIVKDANGCTSVKDITVTQPTNLVISMSVIQATCGSADGAVTASVTGGTTPYQYAWTSGATGQTAVALGAGLYYVTVTDYKACTSVAIAALGEVGGPTAFVDSTKNSDCGSASGSIYTSITGGVSPYTYTWSNGASTQDLTGTAAGTYTLSATDAGGCKSVVTAIISALIPDAVPICIVTVDTVTGKNLVVWEKPVTLAINSFNIYRESTQSGVYFLIGNVPYDSLSLFHDPVANPLIRSWRYKITTIDTCANVSLPSPIHKTMHLTINLGLNNTINLIWDYYEGFSFSTYYIYRFKPQTGWLLADSVPNNLTSYTDYSPPTFYGLQYMVEAKPLDVCSATKVENHNSSRSNRSNSAMPPPNNLSADSLVVDALEGTCNGSVTVIPSGGITPYTYLWNTTPPQTTATATGLCAGDYEVTVTESEGDVVIANATVGTAIGINENGTSMHYSLFPNPVKSEMNLVITLSSAEKVNVVLVNTLGQETQLLNTKVEQGENFLKFDMENFSTGVYYLRMIVGANKPEYLRFVKAR